MKENEQSDWKGVKTWDTFRVIGHSFNIYTTLGLICFIALAAIEVWVGNQIGVYPSKIYACIATRDFKTMESNLKIYGGIIGAMSCLIALKLWISDVISVYIRKKLVFSLQKKYMSNNAFYDVQLHDKNIDNPDGRLTNDPLMWAQLLIRVLVDAVQAPVYICWYGYLTITSMGWKAAAICFGFAVVSLLFSRIVMTPIIKLTYKFEAANANYRLTNVLIKENSEIIALSRGQSHEKAMLDSKLNAAVATQMSLAKNNILLNVVSQTCNFFGNGLVYVCIYACTDFGWAPEVIGSFVALTSFYTLNFIYGLTMLMTVVQNFAKLCGYSTRIQELWHFCFNHTRSVEPVDKEDRISMSHVDIKKPDGSLLYSDVTFSLARGGTTKMFVTGPSGCGKSSLFRVLGELWPASSGVVTMPESSNVMVMTQRSYIPPGTIYDACAFPESASDISKERIDEALQFLELWHLVSRPEECWSQGLSPGERQRIALARIFVHKPRFLLMDEATSAIPERLEAKIYRKLAASDTVMISIAHRQKLKAYHEVTLELDGLGHYILYENGNFVV